jgi:hypothetical protein
MKLTSTNTLNITKYSQSLLAAAIATGSLFQLIAPAFAAPAPTIKNQATATYEDPENPADPTNPNDPNRINTSSNVVEVIIQEVAGITVQQKGITDATDAPVASMLPTLVTMAPKSSFPIKLLSRLTVPLKKFSTSMRLPKYGKMSPILVLPLITLPRTL